MSDTKLPVVADAFIATRDEMLQGLPANAVVAELGTFRGDFAALILSVCNPKLLYLVDTWHGTVVSADKDAKNRLSLNLDVVFPKLVDLYKDDARVKLVRKKTVEFLREVDQHSLDWAYVDADHSYAGASADIAGCMRAVKPGGYICGHDYIPRFAGVIKAVQEAVHKYHLHFELQTRDGLPSFKLRIPV